MVPLPPVATTLLLIRNWNTPGSSAGTVIFRSSTVGLQASDSDDAVAVFPDSVQTRLPLEASNGVWKTPTLRPCSNVSVLVLPAGGGVNLFWSPIGICHGVVVRVAVAPVRDVLLPVVEEDAFEHRRDLLRLLLGLFVIVHTRARPVHGDRRSVLPASSPPAQLIEIV